MNIPKTASELMREGITKIRREPWNEYAYLELYVIEQDGKRYMGPWCELYDVFQHFRGDEPVKMFGMQCGLDDPVWEPWTKPADFNERAAKKEQGGLTK